MKPYEPLLPQDPPPRPSFAHLRVRQAGTVILFCGILCAALIYFLAPSEAGGAAVMDSRQYEYQVQRIGGQAGLLMVQLNAWLGSLWHGERLAYTVGVLSIVIGLACHRVSSMMEEAASSGRSDVGHKGF
jgi:hypothetical protein